MVRLGDGVRVLEAPRAVTLWRGGETLHLDAGARPEIAALAAGEAGPVPAELVSVLDGWLTDGPAGDAGWAATLADLDTRFTAWVPGRWRGDAAACELAREIATARRFFPWPRLARPTLPGAVARRVALLAQGGERVWVEDDLDGGSLLFATGAEVTVFEPEPRRAAWLARLGETHRRAVTVVAGPPVEAEYDLALIYAGTPVETHASLARGLAAVRPGGRIAVLMRPPSEWTLYEQLARSGLPVVAYHREVEPWLLACGLVADAAADLVVVERPAKVALAPPDGAPAAEVRAAPYVTIDFDNLDGERLTPANWERLAELVSRQAPRPVALAIHQHLGERWVWCWCDTAGFGFTAELREDEDHLMVTLLPFDRELEYVVVNAVYALFADRFTRTRPLRTRRWHEENVFG